MRLSAAPVATTIHIHTAASCQFGVPTMFAEAPLWFDAERSPWTCTQAATPQVLHATEGCPSCSYWKQAAEG